MVAVLALAALAVLLGLADPPAAGLHGGKGEQLVDLVRVAATTGLAIAVLLGPGVAIRALARRGRMLTLAFLPLPGLLLAAAVGTVAWLLAGSVEPRIVCLAGVVPALGLVLGALLAAGPADVFEPDEQRALLVTGLVLGLAVARALWSLGPEGELYAGTVSRTLEVGDRSDSRISFIIPQLVAHGQSPYGSLASSFFEPYNFSSRGPVPGLASTPIVLISGGRPPASFAEQPWSPFDHEGFMAYRLAMMTFAATAFLSLWDLVRRLAGAPAAYLGLLLAATTPFLVHEVWFTWPKLLAAALVLAAAICVIERRPLLAGALVGLGYLMHPVALLSLPALALIALWPLRGAVLRRPRVGQLLGLLAGVAAFALVWRLANGSHFNQNDFAEYLKQAGYDLHPSAGAWVDYRLASLGDTLLPLLQPLAFAHDHSTSIIGSTSPLEIRFFFQYWDGLAFGAAIVFLPFLLVGLWRALRRWPWALTATVLMPLAIFVVYWGASKSGLLREGLQVWVLTLFAVLACEQAASRFGWLRSTPVRVVLVLRVVEVLVMLAAPTVLSRHEIFGDAFELTDAVAVIAILAFAAALAALVWRARPPLEAGVEPQPDATLAGDA